MKKSILILTVAGVLASLSAWAVPLKVTFADGPGSSGGGEFIATILDTGPNPDVVLKQWTTFCLEKSISLSMVAQYDFSLDGQLVYKGGGGSNPDPISIGTGLLYSEFVTGTLPYAYSDPVQRELDANYMQFAIWWLEDEISLANPAANPFLTYAANKISGGVIADLKADNGGAYRVAVLNVWNYDDKLNPDRQSVLIPFPEGGATGLLLALGISGLAHLRRKP